MSCLIVNGLSRDCQYLLGGLNKLYLANYSEVTSITGTGNTLNTITMVSGKTFYEFEFERGTASFTNELTVSNGQKYITQNVVFSIGKTDSSAILSFESLSLGKFIAIAMDHNGIKYVLGRVNGLEATAGTINSGLADGDFAGLNITLGGAETEVGKVLESSTVIPVV